MRKHQPSSPIRPVSPADRTACTVLADVRESRRVADEHEVRILAGALAWARLHQVDDPDVAAQWVVPGAGHVGLTLAGPGAPMLAEWCVAELATVLGLSTDAGMRLMADAVELGHRLPGLWTRVQAGEVKAWRARQIATQTTTLSPEAAAFVDRQVAPFAHSITGPGIERLVADAMARFMPETAAQLAAAAEDARCFTVDHQQVSFHGTSRVFGELDLADALDLDAAVSAGAAQLKALGSVESLDARRAAAVGELARRQLAFGFEDNTPVVEEGARACLETTTPPRPERSSSTPTWPPRPSPATATRQGLGVVSRGWRTPAPSS